MSKRFALQSLLDLAQVRSDAAAARLGAVNERVREMEERLALLHQYRAEYAAHLARAIKAGIHSVGWRNFREFLGRIDLAIEQQRESLEHAKHEAESSRRRWHDEERSVRSFDALRERHRDAERKSEARQEQKEQDGLATRRFRSRSG